MSYLSIVSMASSQTLIARVAAAAADEGQADPLTWAQANIWAIVAADTSWATNWDSAVAAPNVNANPDTGMRNDVISDAMILAVVQPMVIGTP